MPWSTGADDWSAEVSESIDRISLLDEGKVMISWLAFRVVYYD